MIHIHVGEFGNIRTMQISGFLTRETLKDAEDVWFELLERRPEMLALDFSELSQIDSVSINHLFKFAKAASEKDVSLIIFDINEPVKKIFEIIKLDKVIRVIPRLKFESDYLKKN